MQRILLAALLVVPLTADASSRRHRGAPAAVRIELTLGAERMNYSDAIFSGHPTLNGQSVGPVNLVGKSFGAKKMGVFDAAMHIEGLTHHVVLGFTMGALYAGLNHGLPSISPDPVYEPAYIHVETGSSLSGVYVGPTLGTAWTWKSFDLALSTTIGYREMSVALLGFDSVPCKGGRCAPTATNQAFFAQPRIALGIHKNDWGMGGYFGGDVTPSASGWSTGLYFELADALFRQRASALPPPPPDAPATDPSGAAR